VCVWVRVRLNVRISVYGGKYQHACFGVCGSVVFVGQSARMKMVRVEMGVSGLSGRSVWGWGRLWCEQVQR
jgi:hypothetical protein